MDNKDMYSAGFFKDFYTEILKQCNVNEIEKFDLTDTDIDRFKFISELKPIKEKIFNLDNVLCKNSKTAIGLKIQGNSAFQVNNWALALDIYNEALMLTPTENVEDFAILLANRSAVLYHVKQYKLAIKDIEMATMNYPKDKMYKIKERLARCYLGIDDFHNSLNAFKEMIHCLDESQLPNDKRVKSEKDAQIMLKILQAKLEQIDKSSSKLPIKKDAVDMSTKLNDSVGFGYNTSEGHYAKANNDIKVGDSILIEKPHCAVLLEKYSKTHCQHCFLRTIAPIVCPHCPNVIFCSSECKDLAFSSYHTFECKILPLIWRSGSSINCHMALRIISQKALQYFIDIKDQLNDNLKFDDILRLSPDDYRTVFTLVRHEKIRQPSNFLQYSIMANFLAYCLRQGNYFSSFISNDNQFTELYSFIGGLILRNLQFLQYNTHEVYELRRLKGQPKTIFIGGGIYPTLARFNHSCNPSIVRYYKGTSVYVHAVTNIKPGEVIAENYGPIYSQNPYDERQHTLQDLYKFDCICEACTELWPLYNDMDDTKIRFKCAGGDTNCKNILIISPDCNDFMVKCNKCDQFTNILKGLKAVQDTDMLKKTAKRFVKGGEYQKAAEKYREILTIMDEFMGLPLKDYCNAQQSYKECLLQYGNKNVHFKE